jgi:hypothetical protein
MPKIVRYEFLGSWVLFLLCCIFVILLPLGLVYVITNTIRIEEEMDSPEKFVEEFRQGKLVL